ncbi:MAG: hypothetical protein ACRDHN_19560 [Thermomicrobiales bacterium]
MESNKTAGIADPHKYISIRFQDGTTGETGVNGCQVEDVIDVLTEKLRSFQDGSLPCRENERALIALEEAGLWLLKRTVDREKQNVEGSYTPHVS